MSRERWLLSTLIAIHLIAISAAALPDPRELGLGIPAAAVPPVDAGDRIAPPTLNAVVATFSPWEEEAYRLTESIRAFTRIYIQAGLRQKWNMFANPITADQYVRVAHYVRSSRQPGRGRVFRELVLPGQPEDRLRLVHMFRDKAILNALETLRVNRQETPGAERFVDLEPIAAFFSTRFRAAYLTPDETITRTEIWVGLAPMPANGERLTDSHLQERWALLQRYRDGPVGEPAPDTPPEPGVLQGESDIVWRLEYVQNR